MLFFSIYFFTFTISLFSRWAEKWLRRWRGVFCGHETQIQPLALSVLTGRCLETVRDLRSAKCVNSEDRSVLTSLQYDLECDAFNSSVPIKATTVKLWWWLLLILTTTIWRKILFWKTEQYFWCQKSISSTHWCRFSLHDYRLILAY